MSRVRPSTNFRIHPLTRYIVQSDGCWLWTGPLNHKGYGQQGKRLAHGLVYELLCGPIPSGKQLDHLCRNRACVNPDHLEPVTLVENVKRGAADRDGDRARPVGKAECARGHQLLGANLYVHPSGQRRCRACAAQWQRESKERRRDKEIPARN